jgi:hypothetical protein
MTFVARLLHMTSPEVFDFALRFATRDLDRAGGLRDVLKRAATTTIDVDLGDLAGYSGTPRPAPPSTG